MGPGETVGQALQDHPGIDGIVFTGSYEVGMRAVPRRSRRPGRGRPSSRWAARTRRSSRATPTSRRRPRGSCAAPSASAARSARRTRASTSSGRSTTSSSGCWSRRPRRSTIGDPLVRANWMGPIIDQRAVDRHQAAVSEARRDGTVFTGGEHLTDGDLARGFYVEPTVVGGLPTVAPAVPRRAVRAVHRGRRGRFARRGDPPRERQRLRADRRRLQRGPGRGPAVPRHASRRASCTSTGAPAPRPARGRAIQAFGGWKGSGSTGKAGLSMYYVAQFMREQSRTIVD